MLKIVLCAVLVACTFTVTAQADPARKKILISSKGDTVDISKDADTMIFKKVEIESEFPGGQEAWQQFLQHNLRYPKKAVRKYVEGPVMLQFIVCTDGTVCNIEAVSGPEILRETALNALKKTPNWKPAVQKGKFVKSYKKQPIVFRLAP